MTALAFLAFGGYLLCLLIQALKSGHNNNNNNNALAAYLKKKKGFNRHPIKYRVPRPARRNKRNVWADPDEEKLYDALVMVSEAYTKYHTINYKNFNTTIKF